MDPKLKVVEPARPQPRVPTPTPHRAPPPWWTAIALLVLALLGVGGWYFWAGRAPIVTVAVPQRGPAVEAVYATGVVEPVRWARVSPTVKGRVAEILVVEGQRVERGTPLARLDETKGRADLAEAEARLRYARQEVTRLQSLVQRDYASRQSYEKALSDLDQAQAAVSQRRQLLADLQLVSPIGGVVLRKDGEIGEIADTTTVLFWIGDLRPLWITADVDEEDIPQVRLDQHVLIKADAFPGRVLDGRVAEITPKGDPVQKSYRVRVGLPDDTPLRIGMSTEVNIVLRQEENALLVPNGAVRESAVFVLQDGKARRRPVEIGAVGPHLTEIRRGIGPEDLVIADPPPALVDTAPVRIGKSKS